MPNRKHVLLIVLGLMLAAMLVWVLRPAPVPVTVTQVRAEHFVEHVEDEGFTRLRDTYTVTAPISAYLQRLTLEPGDAVDRDDPVFILEPLPVPAMDARAREQAREQVAAARARLESARAELELRQTQSNLAERELERNRRLHERDLISDEDYERRRALYEASRSSMQAARHGVEVATFELESARAAVEILDGTRAADDQPRLHVSAPVSGIVTQRHRCCEGPVQAGEPVLELGDLEGLEVQIDLLSMDAVRIRPGMRVEIDRWGGEQTLEGEVRRVEPAGFKRVSALGVDEQRVPVLVSLHSPRDQWQQLGTGYRVEGRFILWEGDDVLQIPTSALIRRDGHWQVYVVDAGRAHLRAVEPGRRSGLHTQILSGLEVGEQIVDHPGDRVEHGARVHAD